MSVAEKLRYREHDHQRHDEEDIYGEDHVFKFDNGGDILEPGSWRSGLVFVHVSPSRSGQSYRASFRAQVTFPRIPIDAEEAPVALVNTMESDAPIWGGQIIAMAVSTMRETEEALLERQLI